jgi:hypothetical protein
MKEKRGLSCRVRGVELGRACCSRSVRFSSLPHLFLKTNNQPNEKTLLGNNRISPPPPSPGIYPFLNGLDPFDGRRLGFVAFRNTGTRGAGGGFYDYTARYGAVREEDTRTLRDSFRVGVEGQGTDKEGKLDDLVDKLGLTDPMDLPLIAE